MAEAVADDVARKVRRAPGTTSQAVLGRSGR